MNTTRNAILVIVTGIFLLILAPGAWSEDYSVTVSNSIYKTTNERGSTCSPVSITCWSSSGNGSKLQLPQTLGYSPQSLTFRNSSCASLDITATCHYFQTIYTNKGRLSETSYGHWADDTRTTTCSGGCHNVDIVITEVTAGNTTTQFPGITCQ